MGEAATHIFVYGTLMPGQPRWRLLQPYAASWEPATARGRLWDTGRGYPAVRFDPGGGPVPGSRVEVVPELASAAISAMDRVEGEGVLFRRVEVATSSGPALAYEWLGSTEDMAPLPHGWPAPSPSG
ncbi:MAG TPA: gamma-glutamylcyclotransferase family protein [Acidimicrobiales bacterium]|nr:gamma-glutamylcyclotransferase family protein [Acidimicrobiales bacterium]